MSTDPIGTRPYPVAISEEEWRERLNKMSGGHDVYKEIYAIAREIADAPQAPRWYQGNFFGDTFAQGQPRAAPAR